MQFQVFNRASIMGIAPQVPHVIISIADHESRRLAVPTNSHTLDVLHVFFHDVDRDGDGFVAFNNGHSKRILDFFQHYRDTAGLTIAHCDAGQCRSPAVLAALQRITHGHDDVWFATRRPNRLVYRSLLEAAFDRGLIQP